MEAPRRYSVNLRTQADRCYINHKMMCPTSSKHCLLVFQFRVFWTARLSSCPRVFSLQALKDAVVAFCSLVIQLVRPCPCLPVLPYFPLSSVVGSCLQLIWPKVLCCSGIIMSLIWLLWSGICAVYMVSPSSGSCVSVLLLWLCCGPCPSVCVCVCVLSVVDLPAFTSLWSLPSWYIPVIHSSSSLSGSLTWLSMRGQQDSLKARSLLRAPTF